MKILVIDVAAEHGGAVSILDQFIKEFEEDDKNEYVIVLSKLNYANRKNIQFVKEQWVKKSKLHRLFFDCFYCRRLVEQYKPDIIFSLQNKGVRVSGVRQEVYFHNALPISSQKIGIMQSKQLWLYQNIIGKMIKRSLKQIDLIYVQADWIKKSLVSKWNINEDKIIVRKVRCNPIFTNAEQKNIISRSDTLRLFYPANGEIYKNHLVLLKACKRIWERLTDKREMELILTGNRNQLSQECISYIEKYSLQIIFVGSLSYEEMRDYYLKTVLVFPSYIETVGMPLIEAKEMNCDIIVADCEYAHESVGEYSGVTFFDPHSVSDLELAISKFLK